MEHSLSRNFGLCAYIGIPFFLQHYGHLPVAIEPYIFRKLCIKNYAFIFQIKIPML